MRKLVLSEEIQNRHLKYCQDIILPGLEVAMNNNLIIKNIGHNIVDNYRIKRTHVEFIQYCINNIKNLSIGKPEKLREFEINITKYKKILENIEFMVKYNDKYISYNEYLLKIFGYNKFSNINNRKIDKTLTFDNYDKLKDLFKNDWTAYNFIFLSKIRVCPYCNRNYITPIYSMKEGSKYKLRADLDHFFPKNKYPYFSMSLYNLVPCCKFCNSSLKGVKEFNLNDVNPYEDNFDDYFKFKADILGDLRVNIDIINNNSNKDISNFLTIFPLSDIYNYHTNQVNEMIEKRFIYTDSYIDELYERSKEYFKNKEQLKQLIIGYIENKERINDEAFLKFRRDIAEQLGFINYELTTDTINELMKKINELKSKI